jgi:hypothetical protein
MKLRRLTILFLLVVSLAACSTSPATPLSPTASDPATASLTTTQTTAGDESEAAEIRALVANFGSRLRNVSLLGPDAAQELQNQYAEFVAPAVLAVWMNEPLTAPGRLVSSPWPDRIEISALEKIDDKYIVTGYVIEMTSTEIASGEAANQIPVQIVVEKVQGRWLVTEYTQEQ